MLNFERLKQNKLLKNSLWSIVLGVLVFYKYGWKTALAMMAYTWVIILTATTLPSVVLVARKRESVDKNLYLKLIWLTILLIGLASTIPIKIWVSAPLTGLLIGTFLALYLKRWTK